MTIEEKAKRYDDALETARKINSGEGVPAPPDWTTYEVIFPELKESKDEKIKRILHSISSKMSFHLRDIFTEEEFQCFDAWYFAWLEKQGEKFIPEDINKAALQYVDTCAVDGEITHDNITEPYWNNHSMMNAYKAGWLEKQALKPKWSEEDDYNVQCCIAKVKKDITNGYPGRNYDLIEWLESIKQRMEE